LPSNAEATPPPPVRLPRKLFGVVTPEAATARMRPQVQRATDAPVRIAHVVERPGEEEPPPLIEPVAS
jgi:hypothetical protein